MKDDNKTKTQLVDELTELRSQDAAPAHNPFDNIVPPDYSGPAESWRIGGWGVPLIARIAGSLRYEHSGGRNRIHFTLPIDRTGM